MRIVDADAIENELGVEDRDLYVQHILDSTPTVDAEPVRHGHWIHEHLASTNGGSYAVVRCSNCLSQYPMTEENYCPNCGARMDEVEE